MVRYECLLYMIVDCWAYSFRAVSLPYWLHCLFIDLCRQKLSSDLEVIVKNLRLEFSELHLKHKSLASEFLIQRGLDAKNKADLERLKGKLSLLCHLIPTVNYEILTLLVSTMKFCVKII